MPAVEDLGGLRKQRAHEVSTRGQRDALGEQRPGAVIDALDLDQPARQRLFHGTALEWLGLQTQRFTA